MFLEATKNITVKSEENNYSAKSYQSENFAWQPLKSDTGCCVDMNLF